MKKIVIFGPTAVGKTEISIKLAKKLNAEIVSADSMQLYKYMDIGTGKVTKEEMDGVVHHMLDVVEPIEEFNVWSYLTIANAILSDIEARGKNAIIIGGTGLYIKAIVDGLTALPTADWSLRAELQKQEAEVLYSKLEEIDPEQAKKLHPNNVRKVIRALEIYHTSGKTMTELNNECLNSSEKNEGESDFLQFALTMDRSRLYDRINRRVDTMFDKGLIEEAKFIYAQYSDLVYKIQAIGYKELFDYFKGKITLEDAKELIKRDSRRYAKRQFTWLNTMKNIEIINLDNVTAEAAIDIMLAKANNIQK